MTLPILVAGDSYSVEWPNQFAKLVPNQITNISSQGRSNTFIYTSVINYLTQQKTKHLVIVGNSFITRIDTWKDTPDKKNYWEKRGHPERHRGNLSVPLQIFEDQYNSWFKTSNICMLWIEYYFQLYCFAHTLKSLGHDFFLFNAAVNVMGDDELDENFRGYLINTPFYHYCLNHPNILAGDQFSIPAWCQKNNIKTKDTGHIADSEGCLIFGKWLHDQLTRSKLI
jgi:hypothetical protein